MTVEPPAGAAGGPGAGPDRRADALPSAARRLPATGRVHRRRQPPAPLGRTTRRAFALARVRRRGDPDAAPASPAEGMIAQALVGIGGVTLGQYGSIASTSTASTPTAPVDTDIDHDAFGGLRAFLATPRRAEYRGPVKWQFVGPVTLGVALTRAGVPADAGVRRRRPRRCAAHVAAIVGGRRVRAAGVAADRLHSTSRGSGELMSPGFPIAPDPAIDLLSAAMARARAGGHRRRPLLRRRRRGVAARGRPGDPVDPGRAPPRRRRRVPRRASWRTAAASRGASIPTDGPIATSADRHWRLLSELWCELVDRGCDPVELRRRSLVTPACGLGLHTPGGRRARRAGWHARSGAR